MNIRLHWSNNSPLMEQKTPAFARCPSVTDLMSDIVRPSFTNVKRISSIGKCNDITAGGGDDNASSQGTFCSPAT